MLEVGSIVGGKFRIERILGQGGMGVVAVATHLQLEQLVALKVLHDAIARDAEVVERFMREARASARLRSEHVCKVSDVGQLDNGEPYIVMELLDGCDLQTLIKSGPLAAGTAADYVVQACVAIAEAHALGIVHRDLKPANLFLTRRLDGAPLIKVLDFGIAKASSASDFKITRTSTIMGSPGYMSPEQLRSARDVDARTDIWALGVILYELVSGKLPFRGDTITELTVKVVMDPPEPLTVDTPAFAAAVYRCLEKEPEQRYPSVAALAADLAPLGGDGTLRTATLIATLSRGPSAVASAQTPAMVGGRATTLRTAAGQAGPPIRRRKRLPVMLAGCALVAASAVAALLLTRREPTPAAAGGGPLAVVADDAGVDHAAPPDAALVAPLAADAATTPPELRGKLRALAGSHDWYAVLQLADLDRDDPEITAIVADARNQYLAQQARAIDAQVKQGQCARAKELAAAARQVVPDDAALEPRARACKPHVATPAAPATLDDANQAFARGEFARAFDIADRLAKATPTDLAATRLAALAACGMKDVDKAKRYAAKLNGSDRNAARQLCKTNSIELDSASDGGPGTGSSAASGEPEFVQAQAAARAGDWDKAFSLADTILQRNPRSIPALAVGVAAACHLRNERAAQTWIRRLPLPRQRAMRQLCAKEGILL